MSTPNPSQIILLDSESLPILEYGDEIIAITSSVYWSSGDTLTYDGGCEHDEFGWVVILTNLTVKKDPITFPVLDFPFHFVRRYDEKNIRSQQN